MASVRDTVDEVSDDSCLRRGRRSTPRSSPTRGNESVPPGSTLVGGLLTKEYYGIAFPPRSNLVEQVNRILLELDEDGTTERLTREWFPTET